MIHNKIGALAAVAALALGLAACGAPAPQAPARRPRAARRHDLRRRLDVRRTGLRTVGLVAVSRLTVNYQAVGSGAGITSLAAKTVDFGACDPPLKPADTRDRQKVGPVQQIPMFLGAITVSYNLPGVQTGLKLEGSTIADIYLGKIKTWNDAAIKALNPGVSLPSTPITVIHRSDSSGTTSGFTGFLSDGRPRIQEQGRRRQGRAVADRHRRQGQRRRRRRGAADHRRRRLRRAGLRAAAQLHLRIGEEQGRQLRRAEPGLDQRRCRWWSRCPRTSGSRSQPRRARRHTRSPRRRSWSSTRTCARPASPAAKRPPRAS